MATLPRTAPPVSDFLEPCRFYPDAGHCMKWTRCKSRASCIRHGHTPDGKAAAEARKRVRTFPMPVWPKEGRPANWCRWCGGEIVNGRAAQRSWHDGREDEPECKFGWQLHTDPRVQFNYVEARDGLKCWDCGESPGKWVRGYEALIYGKGFTDKNGVEFVGGARYQEVRRETALELEHEMPLWLIAHLPDAERRPYFGPKNLRLRCPKCHKAKTKREAAVRGKTNRLAKGPKESRQKLQGGGKLPGKGQGPKMRSRPFLAGHRPLRGRNDLRGR